MDFIRREDYRGFRFYSFDDVDDWTEAENWMPSVTTTQGIIMDRGLKEWFKRSSPQEIQDKILKGTGVGDIVHKKIENLLLEGNVTIEDVDEEHQKHVSQCLSGFTNWWSKNDVEVVETEQTVKHSGYNIAGTFDLFCDINGEPYIIDFKTSNQKNDFKWPIQLTAYATSDPFRDGGVTPNTAVLHLKKGKYSTKKGFTFREYDYKEEELEMIVHLFKDKYGTDPKFSDPVETNFNLEEDNDE